MDRRRRSTMAAKLTGRRKKKSKNGKAKARSKGGKRVKPKETDDTVAGVELIDMEQAITMLKTSRPTFYRWLRAGKLKGVKLGRLWRFRRDDIERFMKGEAPRIDLPVSLDPFIADLGRRLKDAGVKVVGDSSRTPLAEVAYRMTLLCVAVGGNEFHLAPSLVDGDSVPAAVLRYRIDGVLHEFGRPDMRLLNAIVGQVKRMAACDPDEHQKPQDGRIIMEVVECPAGTETRRVDMRVNFFPSVLGDSLTARVLDRHEVAFDLERLGLRERDLHAIREAIHGPRGALFFTGPTGCGKTTAIYSCLSELASPEIKTMTIEDPVEFMLPWVVQAQLGGKAGFGFPQALRGILRSAPNVICVGEVRDRETLQVVCQAALTGHVVMTTLHTADTVATLRRIIELGVPEHIVADSLTVVVAQRLVRALCPNCKAKAKLPSSKLRWLAEAGLRGGFDMSTVSPQFYDPVGCKKCSQTGFKGRSIVGEVLVMTPRVQAALRNGADDDELRAVAIDEGMMTLLADGIRRAASGTIHAEEVERALVRP